MLRKPAWRNSRRRLDAGRPRKDVFMLARSARIDAVGAARPDVVELLGTARYCAPAAPFRFVGRMLRDAARFPGLSRQARGWSPVSGFRATGVLLRHRRAHAPLTAKSPLPIPLGRRITNHSPLRADSLSLVGMRQL